MGTKHYNKNYYIDSTYNRIQNICEGQSIKVGNNTYNTSGTYTDTLKKTNNYDSIVITTLIVHKLPILTISCTSPTSNNCAGSMDTLIVTGNAESYQWSNNEINDTIILTYNLGDTNVISVIGYDGVGCANTATYMIGNVVPVLTNFVVITEITDSLCITDSARVLNFAAGNGTLNGTGIIGNKFDPSMAGIGIFTITYIETFTCGVNGIQANVRVDECIVGTNTQKNTNIIIYPNPNNGTLNIISLKSGSYSIMNELGQTIYTFITNVGESTVNINSIPKGLYIIKNMATGQRHKIVIYN